MSRGAKLRAKALLIVKLAGDHLCAFTFQAINTSLRIH